MAGTLSVSSEGTYHIQQSNIQSNIPTQTVELIGEERFFSWSAPLAWFTHLTAMASNFRSETIHVVTRLAWSAVGYGERG